MSKITPEYAAGLIDGEGSVMLTRDHVGRWRTPRVSITSTTIEFLEAMKDTYGGYISRHTSKTANWKQAWVWAVNGNACLEMLADIVPYMLEPKKKARTWHLLVHYKNLTPRNGKYTPEMLELKQQFEDEFFAL